MIAANTNRVISKFDTHDCKQSVIVVSLWARLTFVYELLKFYSKPYFDLAMCDLDVNDPFVIY